LFTPDDELEFALGVTPTSGFTGFGGAAFCWFWKASVAPCRAAAAAVFVVAWPGAEMRKAAAEEVVEVGDVTALRT
jgi:hypothetical protein